jgi:hypothetical protein
LRNVVVCHSCCSILQEPAGHERAHGQPNVIVRGEQDPEQLTAPCLPHNFPVRGAVGCYPDPNKGPRSRAPLSRRGVDRIRNCVKMRMQVSSPAN